MAAASNWVRLAEVVPEDQREQLAAALLEALAAATWCEVKIEVRDHHLHAGSVGKSFLFSHPKLSKASPTAS